MDLLLLLIILALIFGGFGLHPLWFLVIVVVLFAVLRPGGWRSRW